MNVSAGRYDPAAVETACDVECVDLTGPAAREVTVVTDDDYRCVWRPCEALEEPEDETAAGEAAAAEAPGGIPPAAALIPRE